MIIIHSYLCNQYAASAIKVYKVMQHRKKMIAEITCTFVTWKYQVCSFCVIRDLELSLNSYT